MRTVEIKLYQFNELSDAAKEKARDWYRESESQDFGADGELLESAETAAKLLGIEFSTHQVGLMGGGTRYEPNVYWQLHTQGCGASFAGHYSYNKGSVKAIKAEFGTDTELHRIATELSELQKQHGYRLAAKISSDGRDVHKYAMSIETDHTPEVEESLLTLLRDFADWIYEGIDEEYDYRMSDESIDESMEGYEFHEDGTKS